jgi:hypothetical protein
MLLRLDHEQDTALTEKAMLLFSEAAGEDIPTVNDTEPREELVRLLRAAAAWIGSSDIRTKGGSK